MLHGLHDLRGLFALSPHALPCALDHGVQGDGSTVKLLHFAADASDQVAQRLHHQVDRVAELAQFVVPSE
ncbi:hypothetical protein D3C73_1560510 [compost metagenome]